MKNLLNKFGNWLFDVAEMENPKWYHRPGRAVAVALCILYMSVSELVSGRPFFYGNVPNKKDDEDESAQKRS